MNAEPNADPNLERSAVALLIDDGELENVNDLLAELGTRATRLRGGTRARGWRAPEKLLVVSGRRALELESPRGRDHHPFTTIAVVDEPSRTLHTRLQRMGFDHLVPSSIDRSVLGWMLESALHRRRGQRSQPRFPVGCQVRWRSGWRRRDALLVEISSRGCTLLVPDKVSPRARLEVVLPAGIAGGRELVLKGRPARYRRRTPGGVTLSVLFDALDRPLRQRLAVVLADLEVGPPVAAKAS